MKTHILPTLMTALLAAPPALAAEEAVIVMRQHLAAAEAPQAPRAPHAPVAPLAPVAPGDAAYWRSWAQDFSSELRNELGTMFAGRMAPGKVVKGAPYSAEVVTETNQSLADGNVITRKRTSHVYRDGEGRTRQESGAEGKERTVFINDPVTNTNVVLSPNAKRAIATAPRAMSFRHDSKEKQVVRIGPSEVRIEDGKVFIDGKEVATGRTEVVRGGKTIVIDGGKITIDGKPLGEGEGN